MFSPVPIVLWVAAGLFLICAYPISPPEEVKGFSSTFIANILFLAATCYLVIHTFNRGKTCRRCAPKERKIRRAAYSWLCFVILVAFAGVNHLVRLNGDYITMPLLITYGAVLAVLVGIFFSLRYWQSSAGRRKE